MSAPKLFGVERLRSISDQNKHLPSVAMGGHDVARSVLQFADLLSSVLFKRGKTL